MSGMQPRRTKAVFNDSGQEEPTFAPSGLWNLMCLLNHRQRNELG